MAGIAKYTEWLSEYGLTRIEGWARDGLTDEEIAKQMQISRKTLQQWREKFPVIGTALKKGKDYSDRLVEKSLFRRAIGYKTTETVEELDEATGEMRVVRAVTKEVPPDTTAQIFWLKNRKPAEWRDRRDIAVEDAVQINAGIAEITAQAAGLEEQERQAIEAAKALDQKAGAADE